MLSSEKQNKYISPEYLKNEIFLPGIIGWDIFSIVTELMLNVVGVKSKLSLG